MELEKNFKIFASNIQPSESHREDAISAHQTLRDKLKENEELKDVFEGSFLAGSYKRQTAVKPIKDVDIVVMLSQEKGSARNTLAWVEGILNAIGYSAKTAKQRRSIRIDLANVTMDIVPALIPWGKDDRLKVPCREDDEWLLSHPKKHIENASALNQKSLDGRYVPIVKMLKWWKIFFVKQKHPKGFFLELLCGLHLDFNATSFAEGFTSVLSNMVNFYGADPVVLPEIDDPGISGEKILTGMELSEFRVFMQRVSEAKSIAEEALREESEIESVKKWRKLFGSEFPESDNQNGGCGPTVILRSKSRISEAPPFAK